MARAGYDPNEMANFFAYLEQQSSRRPSLFGRFLSDHPPPANRESRVRREAQLIGATRRSWAPVGGLVEAQISLRRLPPAPTLAPNSRSQRARKPYQLWKLMRNTGLPTSIQMARPTFSRKLHGLASGCICVCWPSGNAISRATARSEA